MVGERCGKVVVGECEDSGEVGNERALPVVGVLQSFDCGVAEEIDN